MRFSFIGAHARSLRTRGERQIQSYALWAHSRGPALLARRVAIKLEAVLPRSMGAGAWRHGDLIGYTSVSAGTSLLPVRLNCPPEITLHTLQLAK